MDEIEQMYEKYYPGIKRYALTLCRNEALAEEITQDTFLKAMGSIAHFRGECSVEVWLCKIAKNTFFSMAKKPVPDDIADYLTLVSPDSTDSALDDRETVAAVLRIIKELDSPYKDVFYMRAMAELSFAVIAGVWDKSKSWARLIYFRARKQIAERMATYDE